MITAGVTVFRLATVFEMVILLREFFRDVLQTVIVSASWRGTPPGPGTRVTSQLLARLMEAIGSIRHKLLPNSMAATSGLGFAGSLLSVVTLQGPPGDVEPQAAKLSETLPSKGKSNVPL